MRHIMLTKHWDPPELAEPGEPDAQPGHPPELGELAAENVQQLADLGEPAEQAAEPGDHAVALLLLGVALAVAQDLVWAAGDGQEVQYDAGAVQEVVWAAGDGQEVV